VEAIRRATESAHESFACIILTLLDYIAIDMDSFQGRSSVLFLHRLTQETSFSHLVKALSNIIETPDERPYHGYHELTTVEKRVQLLASFVYFRSNCPRTREFLPDSGRSRQDTQKLDQQAMKCISSLLTSLSDITFDTLKPQLNDKNKPFLTDFVRKELLSLVDQHEIRGLFPRVQQRNEKMTPPWEATKLLASYTLALLRFFPTEGENIRMRMCLGSAALATASDPGRELPAVKYFWQAVKTSILFRAITEDPSKTLACLRPSKTMQRSIKWMHDDEWRIVMIFLELYTFVLKITYDEEFFYPGQQFASNGVPAGPSITRASALPLDDVKVLVTFFKYIGFTLCYNASEITTTTEDRDMDEGSLSTYFGNDPNPRPSTTSSSVSRDVGAAGISLDYMKGLVTGVLRGLYERDSRRKFLPPGHWLMTSRLQMDGFLSSVVEEEERRREYGFDSDDDDSEDGDTYHRTDYDDDPLATPSLVSIISFLS
jgi:ubiquitin-protein ligase E3 C